MRHVDPAPFEPFLPPAVREEVERARRGEGPAVAWLNPPGGGGWGQVGSSFALLRGHPERLPDEVVGWLVGMAMFADDLHTLPSVMERERHTRPAPFAIEAFVAGLKAGLPTQKRQWKSVEKLVEIGGRVPGCVADIVVVGIVSDSALARGVAQRLAQRSPGAADRVREALAADPGRKERRRLEEALAMLDADAAPAPPPDREEGRLLRLLEAWRETRDPELAEAIALVGAELGRPGIDARSKSELEAAWHGVARAKDPADVHRLLGTPWPGAWKAALARIEALGAFPDDPRIAAGLADAAPRYPSMGSGPMHAALTRVARRIRDSRLADAFEAIGASRWTMGAAYTQVANESRLVAIRAMPEAIRTEIAGLASRRPDLDELWEAVYAQPDDTARLLVLADALQAVGDPRGELVALQVAEAEGQATPAVRKRIRELLAAHIDTWTGPLPGVRRASRTFERGLLVSVELDPTTRTLGASFDTPAWRTLRRLGLASGSAESIAQLLAHTPNLQELRIDGYTFGQLLELGPFPGPTIVGLAWNEVSLPLRAFPDARWLCTMWTASWEWEPGETAARIRAAHAHGLSVIEQGIRPHLMPLLLGGLAGITGEVVLELVDRRRGGIDKPGWRIRLGPDRPPELAWRGGRWSASDGRIVLQMLQDAGHGAAIVTVPGKKPDVAGLTAGLSLEVQVREGSFSL
ncbi:MAG: hypothetical protein H6737_28155 [Alphaproteobacteria bacterium]|nr:hypothetical protein [Alphaproteobacteria bacterium]